MVEQAATLEQPISVPAKKAAAITVERWSRIRNISAFIVFAIVLAVYMLTAQPTVPFWDCGEFIACSYTLGVPHPPGAPLFVLWGRLFSLLPLGVSIAHKINWMSSLFNALAIGVLFLILARIINRWFGQVKNTTELFIALIGAASGAFLAAFGTTYWNNGLEAEVYGFAMLATTLIVYLALLWSERRKDPKVDRYVMLIAYLLYLGIGAHLTVMIMLPPVFLYFIIADKTKRKSPIFWLTWMLLFLVATEFNLFVENMLAGLVIFALAAMLSSKPTNRSILMTILGIWGLAQVVLLFKGTTIPGLLLKDYGFSGSDPSTLSALTQLVIIAIAFVSVWKRNVPREWKVGFFTILLAIIAFSLNSYTIIRSKADPYVDENDPETLKAFRGYMDRSQYGQSMWVMLFHRKGSWASQFGTHERMGFWGFFRKQWANPEKIPYAFTLNGWLFFILGILGLGYAYYRNPKWGALLFFSTLIATIGLLVYLNFSDGTRGIHLEVRDRDYFYTPGFMFFGALMGLGFAALMTFIYRGAREVKAFLKRTGPLLFYTIAFGALVILFLVRQDHFYFLGAAALSIFLGMRCQKIKLEKGETKKANPSKSKLWIFVVAILSLLLPAISVATYWWQNDRSRNYIPYDYAYNILQSCDKNAILFTNGDNDTFPLWFLQAVEGIRTDVRIANLSLLNTNWYIKQLKNQMGVPIKLTDEQIDRLRPYPNPRGDGWIRVQDIMVRHIIENTPVKVVVDSSGDTIRYLDPPVYFAVTVDPKNKAEFDKYLQMEGLVYRVTTEPLGRRVEPNKMRHLLFDVYRFRGLNDTTIYKDENSLKLTQNYITSFLMLAYEYQKRGDTAAALETVERMLKVLPYNWRSNAYAANIYGWAGKWDKVDSLFEEGCKWFEEGKVPPDPTNHYFIEVYRNTCFMHRKMDLLGKVVERGTKLFPDFRGIYEAAWWYYLNVEKDIDKLVKSIEEWLAHHPEDRQVQALLSQIRSGGIERRIMRAPESTRVKPPPTQSLINEDRVR